MVVDDSPAAWRELFLDGQVLKVLPQSSVEVALSLRLRAPPNNIVDICSISGFSSFQAAARRWGFALQQDPACGELQYVADVTHFALIVALAIMREDPERWGEKLGVLEAQGADLERAAGKLLRSEALQQREAAAFSVCFALSGRQPMPLTEARQLLATDPAVMAQLESIGASRLPIAFFEEFPELLIVKRVRKSEPLVGAQLFQVALRRPLISNEALQGLVTELRSSQGNQGDLQRLARMAIDVPRMFEVVQHDSTLEYLVPQLFPCTEEAPAELEGE